MPLEINGEAVAGRYGFAERVGALARGDQVTLPAPDHRTARAGDVPATAD